MKKITPNIIEGYWNMTKHARVTPNWWILEIIDGFGVHLVSYKAMKMWYDVKILTVKEEAETSHACQAYDDKVAKLDKRHYCVAINAIKNTLFHFKASHLDQYSIVAAGLHAIRMCTPRIWIQSFQKVNLQPSTYVLFEQWCIRIKEMLETGSLFDLKLKSYNRYTLSPSWWHLMIPEMKKTPFDIVESNGGFTMKCVKLLDSECLIGTSQLQYFLCCYGNAVANCSQFDQSDPVVVSQTIDNSERPRS